VDSKMTFVEKLKLAYEIVVIIIVPVGVCVGMWYWGYWVGGFDKRAELCVAHKEVCK